MKVGDLHLGYRLLGVSNNSAIVEKDGKRFTILLDSSRGTGNETAATN